MRKDTAASPSKKQKGGSSSLARGRKFIYLFWPPSIPLFLSFCFCCLGVDNEKNKINARLSMRKKWTQRTNQAQHHPSVTLLRCRVPQQKQSTIQTFLNVQTNPRSHCATPTQTATPTAAVPRPSNNVNRQLLLSNQLAMTTTRTTKTNHCQSWERKKLVVRGTAAAVPSNLLFTK